MVGRCRMPSCGNGKLKTRFPRGPLRQVILLAMVQGWAAWVSGCHTYTQRLEVARRQFYNGSVDTALAEIAKAERGYDSSRDVVNLEKSIVLLSAGRTHEAEQLLRETRDRFDVLEEKSMLKDGLSLLTDDTHRDYAGEDYERVLVRVFLALANLMQGGADAEAYSLQIMDKQQQIIDAAATAQGENPKALYQQVAVGAYLRGVLREQTHRDYDDAARAYARVVSWQPTFRSGRLDLQRAETGHHSERGNGVVYLFALVGRGPLKTEVAEVPSSQAMLIADRIFSALGKQTVPPTLAPIKVPKVVPRQNNVQRIGVSVNGARIAATEPITDVTRMAVSQTEAMHDHVLGMAVARRTLKKGVVYGAKELAGIEKGSLIGLGIDLAGVAYEATEHADTRSWSLLPDTIQVVRLELPTGEHLLELSPLDYHSRACGPAVRQPVTVHDGRNTYVLANFPAERLTGKVQVAMP